MPIPKISSSLLRTKKTTVDPSNRGTRGVRGKSPLTQSVSGALIDGGVGQYKLGGGLNLKLFGKDATHAFGNVPPEVPQITVTPASTNRSLEPIRPQTSKIDGANTELGKFWVFPVSRRLKLSLRVPLNIKAKMVDSNVFYTIRASLFMGDVAKELVFSSDQIGEALALFVKRTRYQSRNMIESDSFGSVDLSKLEHVVADLLGTHGSIQFDGDRNTVSLLVGFLHLGEVSVDQEVIDWATSPE